MGYTAEHLTAHISDSTAALLTDVPANATECLMAEVCAKIQASVPPQLLTISHVYLIVWQKFSFCKRAGESHATFKNRP